MQTVTTFPRQAKVVEMRYFAGLEFEQVAVALDASLRTVKRDWSFARAWLRDSLATPAREETPEPTPDAET